MNLEVELEQVRGQMAELRAMEEQIKTALFKKASKSWFDLLHVEYESSPTKTTAYLTFCRVFKRQFKKLLHENFEIAKIKISKPTCFYQDGFFELKNGNIYYFSIDDLREDPTFLIRTAKNFEDYRVCSNDFCRLTSLEEFLKDLRRIVR
jgi:hypothetical protein